MTAPPTTAPPAALICPTVTPSAAASSSVDPADFTDPLSELEVAAQAAAASVDASESAVPVVVTSVRSDGSLDFTQVPAADAAATAAAIDETSEVLAVEADVPVALVATSHIPPSDPLASFQWAHQQYAFTSSWHCGTGAGVTVAVVDTGVAAGHQDFGGRVLPGASSLSGVVTAGAGNADPHGHGTHVAGIIGAGTNDNFGVAGVAPSVTLLPVRALDATGSGFMSDIAAGITWAVNNGADVVNLSVGGDSSTVSMQTAVTYAAANDVLLVAASGNGGAEGVTQYPAALSDVIGVASVTSTGAVSSFSTHGPYVDVAAPGSSIYSTWPDGGHRMASGTSQATPHVAGLAALMISAGVSHSPAVLTSRITSSAVDASTAGFDNVYGYGIISPVGAFTATP